MTLYIFKIFLIYPANKIAAVKTFIANNVDATGASEWLKLTLSATGLAPATHGMSEFHATKVQAATWFDKFAGELGEILPDGFMEKTKVQQKNYIKNAGDTMLLLNGVYFTVGFNADDEPIDVEKALLDCGLKRINSIP